MTPKLVREELRKFKDLIGSNAYISAGITALDWGLKPALDLTVYPNGITHNTGAFTVYADEWDALLSAAHEKWSEHQGEHKRQSVRKIALAIIRVTAETGQCTDAALRYEFGDEMVKMYGDDAVADANKIASNGPFEIVKKRGANGAPLDAVERNPARAH